MEEEILQTKTWDMLGETSSRKRPENSLLEKDLDYQRTVKVAPTITEDVTKAGSFLARAALKAIDHPEEPPLQMLVTPEDTTSMNTAIF